MTAQRFDQDRARGVLWGHAIGDALGVTQEFSTPRDRRPFPALNRGPQTDVVGGGAFHLPAGAVSDDTQMAAALASSLGELGRFDAADVARRYLEWARDARDVGSQTMHALANLLRPLPPSESGRRTWDVGGRRPAGNGSLMRCSPIPVFFAADPDAMRDAVLQDSAITHFDPRCRLACAAFSASIRHALVTPDATAGGMHEAARAELRLAATHLRHDTPRPELDAAVDALREDLDHALRSDPGLSTPPLDLTGRSRGFVRIAFRLAFWELAHAPDFEAALLDVANRGGDSDTNAAITGALCGALAGAPAIPSRWREAVEQAANPADACSPLRLLRVLGA